MEARQYTLSETESEDAAREGASLSGSESDGAGCCLDDCMPPALMSLNRARRPIGCASGASMSVDTDSIDDDDDLIVAPTPPELLRTQGSQHHVRITKPILRSTRSAVARHVSGGHMRVDQTAIPYCGSRSSAKGGAESRRASGVGSRGDVHGSQPSCPTASQPGSAVAGAPGRQPLGDISNDQRPEVAQCGRSGLRKRGRRTGLWSDDQLSRAMQAVEEGMRIRSASEFYQIPVSSLRDHLYGVTTGRKRGGKSVLSSEEDEQVVQWIFWLQQLGHPITLSTLRMKVAEICQFVSCF